MNKEKIEKFVTENQTLLTIGACSFLGAYFGVRNAIKHMTVLITIKNR